MNAHREVVARLRAQGLTGRAIAKELGIPSSTAFKWTVLQSSPGYASNLERHSIRFGKRRRENQ